MTRALKKTSRFEIPFSLFDIPQEASDLKKISFPQPFCFPGSTCSKSLFMKGIYGRLAIGALALFSLHCQREPGFTGIADTENGRPSPLLATVQGNIVDENDQPVSGVAISAGAKTAVTDS